MEILQGMQILGLVMFFIAHIWLVLRAMWDDPLWLFGFFIPFVAWVYVARNLEKAIIPFWIAISGMVIALIGILIEKTIA